MKKTLLLLTSLLALSVNAKDLTDKDVFVSPQETPINILQNEQTTQPNAGGTNLARCGNTHMGSTYWCNKDTIVNEDTEAVSLSTPVNTPQNNQTTQPNADGTNLTRYDCNNVQFVLAKWYRNVDWCNQDPVVNKDTKTLSLSTPVNAPGH